MKHVARTLLLAAATLALAAPAHAQEFVTVLTGGTSGVYYPMGVALSQIYGKAMPGAKTSAQVTKASAENLNLLQAGRGEIAFTLGDALNEAWKGNEEAGFKTPLKKLRTIAAIYPNLHPDRRRRRFRHQDPGRPQGQARRRRRAKIRHRAQCPRHLQGRRHELQGFRQGRVPALRRIGGTDEEPPARRHADFRRPRRRRDPRPRHLGQDRHRADTRRRGGKDRRGRLPARHGAGQHLQRPDRSDCPPWRSRTSWSATKAFRPIQPATR
jgi:hypothetical protein